MTRSRPARAAASSEETGGLQTSARRARGGPLAAGMAGPPPKSASVFLARNRPILAARWVRSCRRALAHLNDPATPIDANWIRLFNSLADRVGYQRVTAQTTTSETLAVAATFEAREERAPGASMGREESIRWLEGRVARFRAEIGGGS